MPMQRRLKSEDELKTLLGNTMCWNPRQRMQRRLKSEDELKTLLARCVQQHPECANCELRTMCIHRPDHTDWSAEFDFPSDDDDAAIRGLSVAKRLLTRARTQYNVVS